MRVLFYTHPHYLEPALEFTRAMAARTEFHLVLETTPRSKGFLLKGVPPRLPAGLLDADPIMRPLFPSAVPAYWEAAKSFRLASFANPGTLHPATVATSRAIVRAIERIAPDIVHFDDVSLRLALALPGLRAINLLNVHDPEPHTGDENWRTTLARRLVFPRVRRFRLHGRAFERRFGMRYRIPPDRIESIPMGPYDVFRSWVTRPVDRDATMVLFAGRIQAYKGLDILYAAAPSVARRVPGVRFVVAGEPVPGYQLPVPPELPNGGRIDLLLDYIPSDRMAELQQRAAVVACPYRDATQSGVVLTAYAFGTPVVATATGSLPEYVGDGQTGLLVEPGNAEQLADALVRALTDGPLRRRMSEGIAHLRDGPMSWTRIAERVLDAYQLALE